ncbi:TnsA endonuclease N-terminal domain-containing protein [Massilia psychrophila]|nr:TnsA endonuclease N-terminal domain-containing protein [Massilia psychrophila]
MSRRPGVTTGRMHHLFSDNEDHFFLMADYAAAVLDIREQFPLFPEDSTHEIARSMAMRHPRYPCSTTPVVMTTDFLLTVVSGSGARSLAAWSIKSADELRGRHRKAVLAKLEIERRYWLQRGVPWYLFTNEGFDQTVIDNLDWISYFTVEGKVRPADFVAQLPTFLSSFEDTLPQALPLKGQLRACSAALGNAVDLDLITDMFRFCVWHHLIDINLKVPIGLQCIPVVFSIRKAAVTGLIRGENHESSSAS